MMFLNEVVISDEETASLALNEVIEAINEGADVNEYMRLQLNEAASHLGVRAEVRMRQVGLLNIFNACIERGK